MSAGLDCKNNTRVHYYIYARIDYIAMPLHQAVGLEGLALAVGTAISGEWFFNHNGRLFAWAKINHFTCFSKKLSEKDYLIRIKRRV